MLHAELTVRHVCGRVMVFSGTRLGTTSTGARSAFTGGRSTMNGGFDSVPGFQYVLFIGTLLVPFTLVSSSISSKNTTRPSLWASSSCYRARANNTETEIGREHRTGF